MSTATSSILILLMLTVVAIVDELLLGLARRPARAEADADHRARVMVGRADPRRRSRSGSRHDARLGPARPCRRDPRNRAGRRPVDRPGPDGPAVSAGTARRVLRAVRAGRARPRRSIGPLLYGVIVFLFVDRFGTGAYQIAILSLLGTMLIGLWLVWPVRDDLAGYDGSEARSRRSRRRNGPRTSAAAHRRPGVQSP